MDKLSVDLKKLGLTFLDDANIHGNLVINSQIAKIYLLCVQLIELIYRHHPFQFLNQQDLCYDRAK